jgi:hypothetical protein
VTFSEELEADARRLIAAEFSVFANIKIRRGNVETEVDLSGVFDRTFTEISDEGLPITSQQSRLTVAENQWLEATGFALTNGEVNFKSEVEVLSLPGMKFRIAESQSNGHGWATLYLQRVIQQS